MLSQLIKEHKERKQAFIKHKEEKKQKEIEKIPYSYINEKNMEELYIPGNKIINFQILSPTIFKNLQNKDVNYYHINNLLNKKKSDEYKNKNNIIIPKSQTDYQNIKIFFDQNNRINSNVFDNIPIMQFIILIQKIYRGYIIRKKFTQIYKYVRYYLIILQKNIRGFLVKMKYIRFIDCLKKIVFIQLFYKKYFQKKLRAIELIQKNFRIYFDKKIEKINRNYQKGISNLYMSGFSNEKIKSSNRSSYQQKKRFLYALDNIKKNNSNQKQKNNSKQIYNNINTNNNNYYTNMIQRRKKEEEKDITNQFLQETNRNKIINTLLYNKNFMLDADEKFNTDYYRSVYKTKFVYPNLRKNRKKNGGRGVPEMKLEDRLIQYGEDKKLKLLLNSYKYHEEECKKCSFQPKINKNEYEFEDSFYIRNLKFMEAKRLKLEYNKIKEEEIFRYECTFKPKINYNNSKRTLDDLFLWQEKINKEKEEMKQLYEKFTENQIQNLINYKPKDNYYSNMKYLEKMAEKIKKEENNNLKRSESKSSYLTTNGYVDVGFDYDVWPLHLKKDFH